MVIWKYQLPIDGAPFKLAIPRELSFLTVQIQRATPCLWAEVNPESPEVQWNFEWVGTGYEPSDIGEYVGTVQLADGDLVLHLYELGHDEDDAE